MIVEDYARDGSAIVNGRKNGFSPPYPLSSGQVGKVEDSPRKLRPQVKAIMESFSDINAALAREEVRVVPAHGEHTGDPRRTG